MLTKEQNDLLTQTGPGTPGGALLRRYWQPVALASEIPLGGDPLPIDILSEALVLFRDEDGRLGLLGRHCPHRGADLSYGRVEDGGLRCLYHGWLFDVGGKCLEQPAEPKGSTFKDKICQKSYPVVERGGAVFAYMGPGEPPLFPAYDFFAYPPEHVFARKLFKECNYLQANEGNYDPAHVGFLHRSSQMLNRSGLVFGDMRKFGRVDISDAAVDPFSVPALKVEDAPFGMRIFQVRDGGPDKTYLRVTTFGMPNFSVIAGPQGGDGHVGIWHVPINDHVHWRFGFTLRRDAPIAQARETDEFAPSIRPRDPQYFDGEFHHRQQLRNRYLQDRSTFADSYTGMGSHFSVHDAFATESQGSIQDRTQEHLGRTDLAIGAARRMMLRAIADVQEGRDPVGVVRSPSDNDFRDMISFDVLVENGSDYAEVVRAVADETGRTLA
ncbi:Rieske 2Fe-2S domain-containing protein [Sphingobium lignivorans]|uniref:Phenylpropionate dioxygenase-like ring-hydroxylating dioxygenase large terminal subunit n=1 Tax=Sphingobium lignivorans TaxID=2735886 RepID=A0ABR6NJV6_9SPHN|nr:Rieske 2Fe-2S domain-containing protein [Sphingobium lignivorans]MBB5987536.1 phenylpropionate dioxygenase-like ring-hydroxylating dioxygenase large terminal subunit [Sphingobium lignivorans]